MNAVDRTHAPGHPKARAAGCICPRADNRDGLGIAGAEGRRWLVDVECPLHPVTHPDAGRGDA